MSSKEKSDVVSNDPSSPLTVIPCAPTQTTMQHHPALDSDAPKPSEGSQKKEQSRPSAEPPKDEAKEETKEHKPDSGEDTRAPASPHAQSEPADDPDADSDSERGKSPDPESVPCTCHCGGCCCHGTLSEPQHCVRCHTNYTFNHSQACTVPHVFYSFDRDHSEDRTSDVAVRSVCCGSDVFSGEPIKGDWLQPFPCFIGWHTTEVDAVKEQYNGLNVLRCDPGPGGKCRRERMKHHAHYKNFYEDKVKYNRIDIDDRGGYLKRKRDELGNEFQMVYEHVDEKEKIGTKDMQRWRKYH